MKDEIIKYIGKAEYENSIVKCEQITMKIFSAVPESTDAIGQFITDAINEKCNKADLTERLVALIDDYRARRADMQLTDECLSDLRTAIQKTLSE